MKVLKIKTGIVETNTYFLYNDQNECVIVDPGDDIPAIFDVLEANSLTCKFVLLTHCHFDHCNACLALQQNGAKVYMHKKELALIRTADNLANKFGVPFNRFEPNEFVKDGQEIELCGMVFKVMHTPGHTVGSSCYIVENFLFSGDTIMYLSCGRTDFPTGNARDMKKSLSKIVNLDKNYMIFPGHNNSTQVQFEKKNNPYV